MQNTMNLADNARHAGEKPLKRLSLAAALAAILLAPMANGQTFNIPNHSFEDGIGYWGASSWTNDYHPGPTGGNGVIEVANASISGKDGSNYVRIQANNGHPNGGTTNHYLYSDDLGTYAADTEYTLTVAVAKPGNASDQSAGIGLRANGNVELLEYYSSISDLGTGFTDFTVTLDTAANPSLVGQTISVVLALKHDDDYYRWVKFDDVRLEGKGSSSEPPPTASVSIPNYSFEDDIGYWSATDWTNDYYPGPTGVNHVIEVVDHPVSGKDGNNFVSILASNGHPHQGTSYHYLYSSDLGTYAADTEYALTVAVAKPGNASDQSAGIGLRANGNVELLQYYAADSELSTSFTDFTVTLDTAANPSLVGQTISVVLALEHNDDYLRGMLFDNVRLDVESDSGTEPPPTPPSDYPLMGMGLAGTSYWGVSDPFVEVSRLAGGWISFPHDSSTWNDQRSISLRSDGYPASLQSDQAVRSLVFTHNGSYYPTGEYVLTWEGEGVITVTGSPNVIVSDQPGRRVIDVTDTASNGLFINIWETDPSDPIRDINLWLPGYENSSSIFNPVLLDNIAPFEVIRFMDWGKTNNSPLEHWSERSQVGDAHYSSSAGVPYELMIALSNETEKDMWISVPHRATDAFVSEMAKLIRDNLDPSLRVWVEYSNEVWNWQFSQSQYNLAQANANDVSYPYQYGLRSAEIFDIFAQEFGGLDRIVRVVAGQAGYGGGWILEQALIAADGNVDVGSIASYFTHRSTVDLMWDEWDTITYDDIFDKIDNDTVTIYKTYWEDNQAHCDTWGIPMVSYEGGQHLVGNNAEQRGDAAFVEFIAEVNRHPRMYDSYRIAMDQWVDIGGSTWVAFVESGGWGSSGYWGHKEYGSQPVSEAHKYRALVEWLEDQED